MSGWLVESIGQWLLFPIYMICGGDDMYSSSIILPFYSFFQFILVPYTHLVNESRIKPLILESGWSIAMTSVLKLNYTAVVPRTRDNLELGLLNRNDNSTNAANAISHSVDEPSPRIRSQNAVIIQLRYVVIRIGHLS